MEGKSEEFFFNNLRTFGSGGDLMRKERMVVSWSDGDD